MLGDITLVAGDAEGNVTNWFFVKSPIENVTSEQPKKPGGGRQGMVKESKKLTFIRELAPHRAAIDDIVPSPRNRALLIGDRDNDTSLDYTTSQRRLLSLSGVTRAAFSSRGDVICRAGRRPHQGVAQWRDDYGESSQTGSIPR